MKTINFKALVLWLVIGGLIGWQLNSALTPKTKLNSYLKSDQAGLDLSLFWDVWEDLDADYFDIDTVDSSTQVHGAIRGLVDSLDDPYSIFMDPSETEEFQTSLNGELEGVGMELTVREGKLVVVSPLKDTPAEKAGILPGDFVYLVDGQPTSEMTLFDAIMAIRGEPGTEVVLTMLREGVEEPLEIPVIRATINVPSVELNFEQEDGSIIAHLALYQFGDKTTSEFQEAIREIQLSSPDALVLDLRLNGGGYLDVSLDILSEFFEEKEKAVIVKRRNSENEINYTSGGGTLDKLPMVVLIDEGSASASEIVAGALRDHERAVLMGEQSFGKGSVQELSQLRDGSSLRLTVAKWFTPDDHGIDHLGITPDQVIEMEASAIDTEDDIQLQAALDYLANL